MNSPIAQNIRHIEVLGDFLRRNSVMPKRLFVSIPPTFENWILVQPGARVPKEYGGARLVQRDQFSQEVDSFLKRMSDAAVLKVMTSAELDAIVSRISGESEENKRVRGLPQQTPRNSDFEASASYRVAEDPDLRFAPPKDREVGVMAHIFDAVVEAAAGIETPKRESSGGRLKATVCAKCGIELSAKEVNYCRFNFAKLGRKYLCRKCQ